MMRFLHLLAFFSIYAVSTLYAQSLSARISNPRVEGGEFKWDIEINRTDDWGSGGGNDILGNCDFYFFVNSAGFTSANPTLSSVHSSIAGNGNYSLTTGRAGSGSQAFVALAYDNFGGGSNWYPPLNSWEHLFTASLIIANPAQNSGLSWFESSTGFARGNDEPLTKTLLNDGDITLPVQLNTFSATVENGKILLKWSTQSEINNAGFEVYRSIAEDGEYAQISSFESDESLAGAGNSNTERNYTYEDRIMSAGGTYWYQIADVDFQGLRTYHGPVSVEAPDVIPDVFALHPNFPNPFNPATNIKIDVPAEGKSVRRIELVIYNSLGMKVKTLVAGFMEPGVHTLQWDGRDQRGNRMATGIYFLRMQAGDFVKTRKMMLLK